MDPLHLGRLRVLIVVALLVLTSTGAAPVTIESSMASAHAEGCGGVLGEGLVARPQDVDVVPLDDKPFELRVRVLVNGDLTIAESQKLLAKAATFLGEVGFDVDLDFRTLRRPPVGEYDTADLFAAARNTVDGAVPPGLDAIVVLTSSELSAGALPVGGQAACVGGYATPEQSFAVVEADLQRDRGGNLELGPFSMPPMSTSLIFAHELLHLFGAHHHFSNCAQGAPLTNSSFFGQCSLMSPEVATLSFGLSTINHRIVLGHAAAYRDRHR